MKIEPEQLVIDIVKHELNLPDTYGNDSDGNIIPCIAIGSQNVLLGTTDKLQVIVRSVYTKVLSNRSYEMPASSGITEKKQALYYDVIQIDFMSKNEEARVRRHELVQALKSIYSKYMCDKYCCRIYDIPEMMMNIGQIAGGSAINRWAIRFRISYMYEYTNSVDYYDAFRFTLEDDTNLFEKIDVNIEQKEES